MSKVEVNPAFGCTVSELCQAQVNSLCECGVGSVPVLCQFMPAVTSGGDLWLRSWPHLPELKKKSNMKTRLLAGKESVFYRVKVIGVNV